MGDLVDLAPLTGSAVNPISAEERSAASARHATITAISEHGGFVDIGTDIFDVQVRAFDLVYRLTEE
ncbi:hypothetical protein ACT17_32810 [Mycolicibacterium conceptionense]|uniref:Uncharacterized protein n=2 Tax=Mycolicibacterium conceptionense TaxID=451644 RepID=A0A0J8WLS5_9MYCO|nr:hypothetical protein ACT17_32810 [Mycolicibacterium conceptionense]